MDVKGELEYENFNAAGAKLLKGKSVHPGYAKER
jgi:hypothetical protein